MVEYLVNDVVGAGHEPVIILYIISSEGKHQLLGCKKLTFNLMLS